MEIPLELKEWVIDQYYSQNTLSVYCDASVKNNQSVIGIDCCYVVNGIVKVKQ